MAKPKFTTTISTQHRVFDDIDAYREFCVDAGYKFDEASLYDMRSYVFQQFSKAMTGKRYKDQWAEDARRLNILL